MKKLTVAKRNEMIRNEVIKLLNGGNFEENFKQVAGTKFAVDVVVNGITYVCRVDIVVPKEQDILANEMNEEFIQEQELKEQDRKEKEIAKQKKIKKDTAARAKAKAEKGE